jgi:hypothetical protein
MFEQGRIMEAAGLLFLQSLQICTAHPVQKGRMIPRKLVESTGHTFVYRTNEEVQNSGCALAALVERLRDLLVLG